MQLLFKRQESLESRGKRKKSGAARPPLLFRLSGHNRSHSQPETDYAAMYLHLTGLTIRGFFSALLPIEGTSKVCACISFAAGHLRVSSMTCKQVSMHPNQRCATVACLQQCRAKRHPCHAPIAQFKWKLDELLGSDPAIQNN